MTTKIKVTDLEAKIIRAETLMASDIPQPAKDEIKASYDKMMEEWNYQQEVENVEYQI